MTIAEELTTAARLAEMAEQVLDSNPELGEDGPLGVTLKLLAAAVMHLIKYEHKKAVQHVE